MNLNRLSFRLPALVACLLLAPGAKSQEPAKPRRHFEVASIKAAVAGPVLVNPLTYFPGGRFTATNVTLVDVIVRVYPTRRIQMQGGPSWIDSERFDIVAKADAADGEVKDAEWHEMVQSLLEDRFQLSFHRETKEMPVLALALGKDPPRLKPAKDDEQTVVKMGEHGDLIFQKMPMGGLVNTLSNIIHQPVVDKTGLEGIFDLTIDTNPVDLPATVGPGPGETFADRVLAAIEDQLGFKIEHQKTPLEITIIDRAVRPSEN